MLSPTPQYKASLQEIKNQKEARLKELAIARNNARDLEKFINKQYNKKVIVGFSSAAFEHGPSERMIAWSDLLNLCVTSVQVRVYYKKHSVEIGMIFFEKSLCESNNKQSSLLRDFVANLEAVAAVDLLLKQPKTGSPTRVIKKNCFFNPHELALREEERFKVRKGKDE